MSKGKLEVTMKRFDIFEQVFRDFGCKEVAPQDYKWEPFTWTFTTEPFSLADINYEKSWDEAQNRLVKKLDNDHVGTFAANMSINGDVFPALCVFKDDEDIEIGEGFHRYNALDQNGTKVVRGIYLYSSPDAIEIAAAFNCYGSVGETIKNRVARLGRLYRLKKASGRPVESMDAFAKRFRLRKSTFERWNRLEDTKVFFAQHDVDVSKLSEKSDNGLDKLNSLRRHDEDAAIRIARMAASYNLQSKDVEAVVAGYRGQKSATTKERYLEDQEGKYKVVTGNGSYTARQRRNDEELVRDTIIRLALRLEKADHGALKNMAREKSFGTALKTLKTFISRIE